jgi:hypothetical protein
MLSTALVERSDGHTQAEAPMPGRTRLRLPGPSPRPPLQVRGKPCGSPLAAPITSFWSTCRTSPRSTHRVSRRCSTAGVRSTDTHRA